jgi:aquaglyceroporin related protein
MFERQILTEGCPYSPAILLTNCLLRKLPWRRFPAYFVAQFLGGLVGAGIVYANYYGQIDQFEGGAGLRTVPPAENATAGIFCTYPIAGISKAQQFFSEFIASAILMFVIFALKDDSNKGTFSASGSWFPLALFFLIFGLGACFGSNTGYGEFQFVFFRRGGRVTDNSFQLSTSRETSVRG